MMETIGSDVADEIVKQVLSGLIDRHQVERPDDDEDQQQHMERLEMEQIKLEAVLETSRRWEITGAPLLRWRKKLKRAAQECDETLREYKQRAVEDEAWQQEARRSSFPRRVAHAAKSLVSGDRHRHVPSIATVRRFERLSDGASEFLRFVELGGTPRGRTVTGGPLIRRLLAGEELRYRCVRRSQHHLFCVRPIRLEDRGVEARLLFVFEDDEAPERNLCIGSMLRLSESTDVIGTVIRCLELLFTARYFKGTAESARDELSQLPTQDFAWVPHAEASHKEHWNSIHSSMTQWFRPNPLCCKPHDELKPSYGGGGGGTIKLPDVVLDLEPVIDVALHCQIPVSDLRNMHGSKAVEGQGTCLKNVPHLKLELLFSPHGSSCDDMVADEVESSATAIEVIDGDEQSAAHTNISLEQQVGEFMLPRAINCLRQKTEATAYQMFWKSKHGTAFLQVQKTCLTTKMAPRHITGVGNRRLVTIQQRRRDPSVQRWILLIKDFLSLWAAHAPRRLQSSIVEWIQKANEMQLKRLAASPGNISG